MCALQFIKYTPISGLSSFLTHYFCAAANYPSEEENLSRNTRDNFR